MQPAPRRGFARRLLNAAGRLLDRVSGRQPTLYEPPAPPPEPPPSPPPIGGGGGFFDEPPYQDPGYWEEPEPEPWEPEYDLYDRTGQYIGSNTLEDWIQEVREPREYVMAKYGYSPIDIILELEAANLWDDYDWEDWRAYMDEVSP